MTDITDKYEKFKVPYSTNEKHSPDEFDPKENGGLDNPANRHKDKLLDDICDTHPGSPMCKVFDCWSDQILVDWVYQDSEREIIISKILTFKNFRFDSFFFLFSMFYFNSISFYW